MLILNIKEKGRYIEIPGYKPFRTPAQVDISQLDLTKVLLHLKGNNITKYEIISSPDENTKKKATVLVKQGETPVSVSVIADLVVKDKEQMSNRLDRIEGLLNKLFDRKPEVIVQEVESKSKVKLREPDIEEIGTFIPSINIDDFKSKSNETDRTISTKRDFGESVELLKKLNNR